MTTPSLSRTLLAVTAVFCMLSAAGCATVDQKINLGYAPFDRSYGRHQGSLVVTRTESPQAGARTSKGEWIVGALNNVHGVHQADVLSDRTLPEWVTDALVLELKQAGFTVTSAPALPAGTASGIVISDINAFINVNMGVVTDEVKHELRFTITLMKNGEKVKTFGVASRDNKVTALRASPSEQEKILQQSLQDAMKQVIPEIVAFMSQK